MKLRITLAIVLAFICVSARAQAPIRTQIQDTVYDDQGNLANGFLTVSNTMTMTSPDGFPVPASTTRTNITNGALSVRLVPNIGSVPAGTFYTVVYQLATGLRRTETWVVPNSLTAVNLATIRALSPPVPAIMLAFEQLNPPINCPGQVPEFQTGTGWFCTPTVGAVNMSLESPAASDSGVFQWAPKNQLTILRLSCSVDVGTVQINFDIRAESAPNTPGNNLLPAPLTCSSTTGVTTSFSNAQIPARGVVALDISSTTGSPGVVRIHGEY